MTTIILYSGTREDKPVLQQRQCNVRADETSSELQITRDRCETKPHICYEY